MKKIINSLLYDTDAATLIGDWENSNQYSDANYCAETLYQTPAGRYFLHAQGGANSIYGRRESANIRGYGHRIIPMTDDQARQWCEDHGQVEDIERRWAASVEAA